MRGRQLETAHVLLRKHHSQTQEVETKQLDLNQQMKGHHLQVRKCGFIQKIATQKTEGIGKTASRSFFSARRRTGNEKEICRFVVERLERFILF